MIKEATRFKSEHIALKKRFDAVDLDGSRLPAAAFSAAIRNGNGAVILDKDGVLTKIDLQIEQALKREFEAHDDHERGIRYDFEINLVYKLFGIDHRYNDGATPILALMALNLEASEMGYKKTPNELLDEAVKSSHAVDILDRLVQKHSAHEWQFVMDHMYWWREPGSFFHTDEARGYIRPYIAPSGITGRDAVMTLLGAGIPIAVITNAPNHDLHAAGFTHEDLEFRIADNGVYEEGKVLVFTREHFGVDRMKPNPYSLHFAAQQLGVNVESSIYVGDTRSDVRFAMNSGAIPIGVESGMGSALHLRKENENLQIFPDLPTLAAGLMRGY
jgi:phosphoglycolate phosphatase-like HAD superfamily hydrolase